MSAKCGWCMPTLAAGALALAAVGCGGSSYSGSSSKKPARTAAPQTPAPAAAGQKLKLSADKDGGLYFVSNGLLHGGVWRTDGTPAGTVELASGTGLDLFPPPLALGGALYFTSAFSSVWRTDGTPGGTTRLATPTPQQFCVRAVPHHEVAAEVGSEDAACGPLVEGAGLPIHDGHVVTFLVELRRQPRPHPATAYDEHRHGDHHEHECPAGHRAHLIRDAGVVGDTGVRS